MTYTREDVEFMLENYLVKHESFLDYWIDIVPAINKLPTKAKLAILFHGVHGMPFDGVASLEGNTGETWRRRYEQGIKQLLEILNGKA